MTKKIERRLASADIQIRKAADGLTVGVSGYAARFDSEAHGEVIRSAAFNRTVSQRDNVRLLVNHEGVPLASTRAGTLTLSIDEQGLRFDADSLDMANPDVQRLVSAMSRGDIHQCSFAGYFNDAPEIDGLREVREVSLVDVSVVTYPWYEETSVGLTGDRSGDLALVCMRSLTPEQREEVIALLDDRGDGGIEPPANDAPSATDDPDPQPEVEEVAEKSAPTMTIAEARSLLGLDPAA